MTAPSANQKVVEPSSSDPSRDEHAEATSHLQANKTQSPTSDVRGLSAPAETNNPIARAIENMIIGHAPDQTRESAAIIERIADQRNEHTLYSSVWGALAAALIKATPTNTPASTRHRCEELLREITLAEEREKKRKRGDGRDDTFLRALSSILGERAAEDVFSKIEDLRKTNNTSPQASAEIARELLTALSPGDTLLTLTTNTHTEKREDAGSDLAGVAAPEALQGLVKELQELGVRAAQVEEKGHPTIAKALSGLAEEKIAEHGAELAALSSEEQGIIRSLFQLAKSGEVERLANDRENSNRDGVVPLMDETRVGFLANQVRACAGKANTQAADDLRLMLGTATVEELNELDLLLSKDNQPNLSARLQEIGGDDLRDFISARRDGNRALVGAITMHSLISGDSPRPDELLTFLQVVGAQEAQHILGAFESRYGKQLNSYLAEYIGEPPRARVSERDRSLVLAYASGDPARVENERALRSLGLRGGALDERDLNHLLLQISPARRDDLLTLAQSYARENYASLIGDCEIGMSLPAPTSDASAHLANVVLMRAAGDAKHATRLLQLLSTGPIDSGKLDVYVQARMVSVERAAIYDGVAGHFDQAELTRAALENGVRRNLESTLAELNSNSNYWNPFSHLTGLRSNLRSDAANDRALLDEYVQQGKTLQQARSEAVTAVANARSAESQALDLLWEGNHSQAVHALQRAEHSFNALDEVMNGPGARAIPDVTRWQAEMRNVQNGYTTVVQSCARYEQGLRYTQTGVAVVGGGAALIATGGAASPLMAGLYVTLAMTPGTAVESGFELSNGESAREVIGSAGERTFRNFMNAWGGASLTGIVARPTVATWATQGAVKQAAGQGAKKVAEQATKEAAKETIVNVKVAEQSSLRLFGGATRIGPAAPTQVSRAGSELLARANDLSTGSQTVVNVAERVGFGGFISSEDAESPRNTPAQASSPEQPRLFVETTSSGGTGSGRSPSNGGLTSLDGVLDLLETGSVLTTTRPGVPHVPPPSPAVHPPTTVTPPVTSPEDSNTPHPTPSEVPTPKGPIAVEDVPNSYVRAVEQEAQKKSTPETLSAPAVTQITPVALETISTPNALPFQPPTLPIRDEHPHHHLSHTQDYGEQMERLIRSSNEGHLAPALSHGSTLHHGNLLGASLSTSSALQAAPSIHSVATSHPAEFQHPLVTGQTQGVLQGSSPVAMRDAKADRATVEVSPTPSTHTHSLQPTVEPLKITYRSEQPRILDRTSRAADSNAPAREVTLKKVGDLPSPPEIARLREPLTQHTSSKHGVPTPKEQAKGSQKEPSGVSSERIAVSLATPRQSSHQIVQSSPTPHDVSATPSAFHQAQRHPQIAPSINSSPEPTKLRYESELIGSRSPTTLQVSPELTTLERLELAAVEINERARKRHSIANEKREALEAKESRAKRRLRAIIMHQLSTISFDQARRQRLLQLLIKLGISERDYRELASKVGDPQEVANVAGAAGVHTEPLTVSAPLTREAVAIAQPFRPPRMRETRPVTSQSEPKRLTRADLYARMKA